MGIYCEEARVKNSLSNITGGNATMVVYSSYTPNFKCNTDGNGKGILNSKVGLITYDEDVFAGGYHVTYNRDYYLYSTAYSKWTMTPSGFMYSPYVYVWGIMKSGDPGNGIAYVSYALSPVINLKSDVEATGTGTSSDPYVVQTN